MNLEMIQAITGLTEERFMSVRQVIDENSKSFVKKNYAFIKDDSPLISTSLYSYYPLLFQDILELKSENLEELLNFSNTFFISLFLFDKIYDEQKFNNSLEIIVLLDLYHEARNLLEHYCIKFPEIQYLVLKYYSETKEEFYSEKFILSRNTLLDEEEIKDYCSIKYSYAKIAVLIYSCFSLKENLNMNDLLKSHDLFAYGRQILDDMEDFQEDFLNGQFNIYNCEFLKEFPESSSPNLSDDIQILLLSKAKEAFEKSIIKISNNSKSKTGWERYIEFYLTITKRRLSVLTEK
ncbi:MAG: hypothetical protein ACI31W_06410 [Lactococcus sp.]